MLHPFSWNEIRGKHIWRELAGGGSVVVAVALVTGDRWHMNKYFFILSFFCDLFGYQCYYLHTSRVSVFPVCGVFYKCCDSWTLSTFASEIFPTIFQKFLLKYFGKRNLDYFEHLWFSCVTQKKVEVLTEQNVPCTLRSFVGKLYRF